MDLLEATDTVTHCPYKGAASYWSLRVGDKDYPDFVWAYPRPIPEIPKIENLLCQSVPNGFKHPPQVARP
jgi:uncharacterized protein (DUF427 family)